MATLTDNLTAAQTAITAALAEAESTAPSPGDTVVTAVVASLEAAGYTVTAPVDPSAETETPAEDATETSEAELPATTVTP